MCSCSAPRAFVLKVGEADLVVYGLDQAIFSTILSFPKDEAEAWKILWESVRLFNPEIAPTDEERLKPVLSQVYRDVQKQYEFFDNRKEN